MPNSTPVIFKRSLLAVAVVSLSACASIPQVQAPDLSGLGSGIAKAGKATAGATRRTWDKTTYLLGFSDAPDDGNSEPSDEQLLASGDDVNQVLPLADAPVIESGDAERPAVVLNAETSLSDTDPVNIEPENEAIIAAEDNTSSSEEDLVHEVAASETLWDIAKKTTGDANNWHVLADINNLEQNATVFPGQQLLIPADLIPVEYDSAIASAEVSLPQATDAPTDLPADSSASENQAIISATLDDNSSAEQNASPVDLNPGETLWDFAKRTTGDATNWQAIASQNNFTEKQAVTVRPGQTIFVPEALLREKSETSNQLASTNDPIADEAVVAAITETPENAEAASLSSPAAALPESQELDDAQQLADSTAKAIAEGVESDDSQPVTIVEATYKSDDSLDPVKADAVQIVENANIPAQIKVSGTYYPKAVYNDADFSSSLLMRVSPGTTLEVSKAMGTWFQVETDKGIGYVHQRDIQ